MPDPLLALLTGSLLLALLLFIFWPKSGLFYRLRHARRLTQRVLVEDALKHAYKLEIRGERPTLQNLAGTLEINANRAAALLAELEQAELMMHTPGGLQLTSAGRSAAMHVVRAHRLWERYLADETGFHEADWHDQAERREHALTPEQINSLAARLGYPTHDPHGDPIPSTTGELVPHQGQPLPSMPLDARLRIVHIEDEPGAVYAQLVAEGLHPGMELRLAEVTPQRIRFWSNGDEYVLAPIVAANISVRPISEPVLKTPAGETLDRLAQGEAAEVVHISQGCRGPERRRLMDMGILPGTRIAAELVSPLGDPVAYRVRGTLVALRKDQARHIKIQRLPGVAP
jgi:DtxR family transcriptional regulator, Mn-dependent transcriptional regulator